MRANGGSSRVNEAPKQSRYPAPVVRPSRCRWRRPPPKMRSERHPACRQVGCPHLKPPACPVRCRHTHPIATSTTLVEVEDNPHGDYSNKPEWPQLLAWTKNPGGRPETQHSTKPA